MPTEAPLCPESAAGAPHFLTWQSHLGTKAVRSAVGPLIDPCLAGGKGEYHARAWCGQPVIDEHMGSMNDRPEEEKTFRALCAFGRSQGASAILVHTTAFDAPWWLSRPPPLRGMWLCKSVVHKRRFPQRAVLSQLGRFRTALNDDQLETKARTRTHTHTSARRLV